MSDSAANAIDHGIAAKGETDMNVNVSPAASAPPNIDMARRICTVG